jgi:hypothetical protein
MDTETSSENQKERAILEDLDADGRMLMCRQGSSGSW